MSGADATDVALAPPIDREGQNRRVVAIARLSVAASVIVAVLVVATNVVNARLFGAETLGRFALSSSPWLLALAVSNFGENAALIRLLSVEDRRGPKTLPMAAATLVISSAWTTLIGGAILLIVWFGLQGLVVDEGLFVHAVVLVATFVLLINPTWVLQSAFIAYGSGRDIFLSRLVQPAAFLVLSVAFHGWGDGVASLVAASVASSALGLAYVLVRSPAFLGGRLSPRSFREAGDNVRALVSFAWRWAPGNLANALSAQSGLWVIAGTAGTAEAGVYSRVLGLQERAGDLSARLQDGVVPALIRSAHRGDRASFSSAWWSVLGPALTVATIVIPTAMLSAGSAIRVLGPDFYSGGPALMWVVLGAGFMLLLSGLSTPFIALDRPGTSSLISVGRAVVLIAALWPATEAWGAAGASAAFAAALGAECLVRLSLVGEHLRLRHHLLRTPLVAQAVGCSLVGTGTTLVGRALIGGSVAGDLVAGTVGVGAGLALYVVLRRRGATSDGVPVTPEPAEVAA